MSIKDRVNASELWGCLSTTERSNHSYREMPTYVKIIVLAQAAAILSFTVWIYQVYLNDIYFQEYVISLFISNIFVDVVLYIVTVPEFALGTFTLLGSISITCQQRQACSLLSQQPKAPQ